ncbi:glycosyltransferase family 2 protein [Autumnicola musiva]|uniref:Glycosyltransferase family 2 protein n=1 Tax=Autumnicola musiva TaxID=3075589 RepID=A0ABU3D626_9FLAO|nr:glycosyltransferase family 2 protein [Zunongwangia sp. F117]MDT0676805.1 glycosyltransferase family 2 protein [Zunongwangia sp. F117]
MELNLVSIIIPTYNRAHLIGETLESVIAQTYKNWECIVVDDGSTDYTDKLLEFYCKKDSRIHYYHRPKGQQRGANTCRNYGFEVSKGHFINWFDSDDVMLPPFVQEKVNSFTTTVEFVISSGYYVDENLTKEKKIKVNISEGLFKSYMKWNAQIITNSVLFRRGFLANKELFKAWLTRGQEEELFSRLFLQLADNTYTVISEPLFLYRKHSKSKSFQNKDYIFSNKESESYVYLENFKRSCNLKDPEIIQLLWKRLIHLYFFGIDNDHFENSKKIINTLAKQVLQFNIKLSIELFIVGNFLCFIKRDSYRIRKRWINFKILNN